MTPALSNAIYAMSNGPFEISLAEAVTNSGDTDSAATWLLDFTSNYLKSRKMRHDPLSTFDFMIHDIEALNKFWPAFIMAEFNYRDTSFLDGYDSPLPKLARYLAERLPTMWDKEFLRPHVPVTRALVIADNVVTLVAMFGTGHKPTGSKDPFALRRAAIILLENICFPYLAN